MRVSVKTILFYLFISLPVTFKLEVSEGIYLYPQEPCLIILFFIILFTRPRFAFPKFGKPFLFYLGALALMLCSTLISFFNFGDISGLFKVFKYVVYLSLIIYLSGYSYKNFIGIFNKFVFISVAITLGLYLYSWYTFAGPLKEFLSLTTWDVNYVPSGLSNLNLNIFDFTFSRSAGNHGIYGSYLVLAFLLNFYLVTRKKELVTFFNYLLLGLILFNLIVLTSRETLLIFFIVFLLYFLKDILRFRIQKKFLYLFIGISIALIFILLKGIDFGLISKIKHTIQALNESGGDQNIKLRFQVWILIIMSFTLYPVFLLIGYGYNHTNFNYFIGEANNKYHLYETFASVPESLFFIMLAYGGIFCLVLILLFFLSLFLRLHFLKKFSALHELFFYFTIGLFISNNTGGSLMSDLFLAQFAIFYFFLNQWYVQNKDIIYFSKG
ncbi:MAG: hypothetical protein ACO1O1_11130 [Adhaeribacter sp.]